MSARRELAARSHEELADDDAEEGHCDGGGEPRHHGGLRVLLGPVRVRARGARVARRLAQAEQLLLPTNTAPSHLVHNILLIFCYGN